MCVVLQNHLLKEPQKKPLSDDFKFLLIGDLILHIKVRNAHEIFFLLLLFISPSHSLPYVQSRKRVNLHGRTRIHLSEKNKSPRRILSEVCYSTHASNPVYIFSNFPKISYIKFLAISIRL